MLRTVQQHHVQLSIMADQKANMLLGATFVVFTLAIGQSRNGSLSLPLFILAVSAFLAAGLAALAVMPSTVPKPASGGNWLFFGTFTQIEEDEFQEKMMATLGTADDLFKAMLHDLYQLGCVLQTKKYVIWALHTGHFLWALRRPSRHLPTRALPGRFYSQPCALYQRTVSLSPCRVAICGVQSAGGGAAARSMVQSGCER